MVLLIAHVLLLTAHRSLLVKDMIVDLYVEMLCMWNGFEPLGSERVLGWK